MSKQTESTVKDSDRERAKGWLECWLYAKCGHHENGGICDGCEETSLAAEFAAAREETEINTCLLPIKDFLKIRTENLTEEEASKWLDNIHKFIDEKDPLDPSPCGKPGHFMAHWVEGDYDLSKSYTHSQARHLGYGYCTLCLQQESGGYHAGFTAGQELAQEKIKSLVDALGAHTVARDDWLNTEFPEFCHSERVEEAKKRIAANGGRVSYIAKLNEQARAALKAWEDQE